MVTAAHVCQHGLQARYKHQGSGCRDTKAALVKARVWLMWVGTVRPSTSRAIEEEHQPRSTSTSLRTAASVAVTISMLHSSLEGAVIP